MKKVRTWLTLLLAFQTCLAAGLFLEHHYLNEKTRQRGAVLSFDKESVDRVVLSGDDKSVTLKKTAHGWELESGLPVDETRLKSLFSLLSEQKVGNAVATSAESFARFKVDEKEYRRNLKLLKGEEVVAQLFLGTSPSFKKSHLRRGGEQTTYSANVLASDLPTNEQDWLDKGLLQSQEVSSLEGADFHLVHQDQGWNIEGSEEKLNPQAVDKLLTALRTLRVTRVVSKSLENPIPLKADSFTYEMKQDKNEFYLKRSDREQVFAIAKTTYESLAVKKADLLAK